MIQQVHMTRKNFHVIWFVIIFLCFAGWGHAQEVQVRVSYDTLYIGNVLAVQFQMENWQGDLENPDFGDFSLAGGPSISSSTRITQGQRSSEKSISFYVKSPESPGTYTLPSQKFTGEGEEVFSDEVVIEVVPNPENIRQNPVISQGTGRNGGAFSPGGKRPPVRGERKKF